MIVENLAERLFVDLKNSQVKIEKPEYILDGAKIGQVSSTNGILSSPAQQFTIFGTKLGEEYKYKFGNNDYQSYTGAYIEFLNAIRLETNLKFYSLIIPKRAVIETKLEEFETVLTRYIKGYDPMDDAIIWRWDALVSAV